MSPRHLRAAVVAGLLLAAAPRALPAQAAAGPQEPVIVDRVIAVVGNFPILESEVQEQLFARQSMGLLPTDAEGRATVRRLVIDSLINSQLMLEAARQDTTIKVSDAEVADAVQTRVGEVRGQFPTNEAYEAELRRAGFPTPEEYRQWLTDQQRKVLLQRAYLQRMRDEGKIRPVIPTEAQMRAWYERNRRQADSLPALLSWQQIVVVPTPTQEAKDAARARADSIANALRAGADFATAAKRFSMDPGSAEQGGSLGWFRRGQMVPQFEAVAFNQQPGTISNAVETSFGYHVIQVERAQPAEVNARHILIMPEITQATADSTRARAERVRDALLAGAPFDSLARIYHGADEEREAKSIPVTQLPDRFRAAFEASGQLPDSGEVFLFGLTGQDDPREKWVIARVTDHRESGAVTFEDVRELVRRRLGEELAVERFASSLRQGHYIRIDDE